MKKSSYIPPIIIAIIALFFSIDNSSIWIDEMITYQVIHEDSFSEMFSGIWNSHNANGGMPLYFVIEWAWTQLFGYTEIGLRSMNFIFAIIFFIVSLCIIRKINAPSWLCVLFFLNPVFIYYMNEARPYVMLLCIGSIYTYLLFYRDLNDYKTLFLLHFTFLTGLLTHMMFGFIILMYLAQCVNMIRLKKLDFKKHLVIIGIFIIPYVLTLCHYMNIMVGAKELGGMEGLAPNWKASIVQIAYYFSGFGGLGLSRNDLRSMLFSQLSLMQITCIALMALGYLSLFLYVIKNKLWKDKHLSTTFLIGVISFGGFCIINILLQTRFWERHIIYIIPVLLIILCSILRLMLASGKIVYISGAILIISMTSISGLRIMFDEYHKKEDYKGIAAYISEKKEEVFLLQGDPLIYKYYKIDLNSPKIQTINNINIEDLNIISENKETPVFLVISSREEFDSGKLYYKEYKTNDLKFNSFRIVQYNP